MKALKMILLVAFVTFTCASFAQDFQDDNRVSAPKMLLLAKVQNLPDLADAIKTQIDPTLFLTENDRTVYVAVVSVNRRTYKISGTYMEWFKFFYSKRTINPFEKADMLKRKVE